MNFFLLEKIEEFGIIKTLKGVASGISVTRSSIRKKFPALYEIARLVNKQVSFLFLTFWIWLVRLEMMSRSGQKTSEIKEAKRRNTLSKEQKRQAFYTQSPEEIFKTLDASEQGLSSQEAAKRLADYGRNELDEGEKKSLLMKFSDH